MYRTRLIGSKYTTEWRVYLESVVNNNSRVISPFHDVPLYADQTKGYLNMIVEIPRWSNAKLEIATKDFMNPIKQDTKNNKLRFVKNHFPYHGYPWNYGAFPQTWEYPGHVEPATGCKGDNDPVDVIEIGSSVGATGQVKVVKVLGAFAMIDEGETDWKVITVDVDDKNIDKLNELEDIEKVYPGLLSASKAWFENYKVPDGKPKNSIPLTVGREEAIKVLEECHGFWSKLSRNELSHDLNIDALDKALVDSKIDTIPKGDNLADAQLDSAVHDIFFIPTTKF